MHFNYSSPIHESLINTNARAELPETRRWSLDSLIENLMKRAAKRDDSSTNNDGFLAADCPAAEFKLRDANMRIFQRLYTIGDEVGHGAFSRVVAVTEKYNKKRTLACKILDISLPGKALVHGQSTIEQVEKELTVILGLNHPNLLDLIDVYFDEANSKCYLVTSLARGGTLKDAIDCRGSFTEDDAKSIMGGILKGLDHMHNRGIAHRDLKPDNILILDKYETTKVIIADFGMAKKLDPNSQHTVCGTPLYIAPEVITRPQSAEMTEKCGKSEYDTRADVWSCGVLLYQLLSGSPPFSGETIGQLFFQIKSGAYDFRDPAWALVSEEAQNLVRDMMKLDPRQRLTAKASLEHPWFRHK